MILCPSSDDQQSRIQFISTFFIPIQLFNISCKYGESIKKSLAKELMNIPPGTFCTFLWLSNVCKTMRTTPGRMDL